MSEEQTVEQVWHEIGAQFKDLGESLARACRTTWESEESRQHLRDVRAGLESMANQIGQAIDEAAASPEGQKVRQEAEQAFATARAAGEQAWQEAQPHLLSALQQVNTELRKVFQRTEE